jgi:PHP family Zn ribbon phosphoesterase
MLDVMASIIWMFIEEIATLIGRVFMAIFGIEPKSSELPNDRCIECDYNLTGSLKANREMCPECGKKIAKWQRIKWKARTKREEHQRQREDDTNP